MAHLVDGLLLGEQEITLRVAREQPDDKHMAEEDLDLVSHLGDYIYEYGPREYPTASGIVREHVPRSEITTLTDYRRRHALYKTDANLRAAHAAAPWVVTWDDHEVDNNYADGISEEDSEPDQDPEVFLRRRTAADEWARAEAERRAGM